MAFMCACALESTAPLLAVCPVPTPRGGTNACLVSPVTTGLGPLDQGMEPDPGSSPPGSRNGSNAESAAASGAEATLCSIAECITSHSPVCGLLTGLRLWRLHSRSWKLRASSSSSELSCGPAGGGRLLGLGLGLGIGLGLRPCRCCLLLHARPPSYSRFSTAAKFEVRVPVGWAAPAPPRAAASNDRLTCIEKAGLPSAASAMAVHPETWMGVDGLGLDGAACSGWRGVGHWAPCGRTMPQVAAAADTTHRAVASGCSSLHGHWPPSETQAYAVLLVPRLC